MAGIPSNTKNSPPKKGLGSAREKGKYPQTGQRKSGSSSSSREEPLEVSDSRRETVSIDDNNSDYLFITANEPSGFKNRSVQTKISRHVMKNYQDKQSSREPSSRAKAKDVMKGQGDKNTDVISSNSSSSNMPIRAPSSVHSTIILCRMTANHDTGLHVPSECT